VVEFMLRGRLPRPRSFVKRSRESFRRHHGKFRRGFADWAVGSHESQGPAKMFFLHVSLVFGPGLEGLSTVGALISVGKDARA
jgi:hypothetical protein